jgi:hypothetical protein
VAKPRGILLIKNNKMNYKIYFTLLVLILSTSIAAQENSFDLYLLIGQSNMAGRGLVEPQDTVIHPQVFKLNKNNQWVPAQDPIHFDKKVAGVGLGRTFGIEMAKKDPDAIIGLIPCAVGGSPIDIWKPGGYHQQTKTYPWDDMEKRLTIALKNGKLKGILWHQGESDSNLESCNEYQTKLKELIQRVRVLGKNEDAPFIAGELGRFKIQSNKDRYSEQNPSPAEIVMKSTKSVVKSDGNAAFVKSRRLNHKGDLTHFDSKSYRILGKRYAKAMLKLQK